MTEDKQTVDLWSEFPDVSAEQWRAKVEKDLKGADFDRALTYRDAGGFAALPLYHSGNAPSAPDVSGFPGAAPHTRGFRPPTAAATRPAWQPAQIVDFPRPEEANRRLLHDLALGVQRVWLRLGTGGVQIGTAADFDRLLAQVEPTFIDLMVDGDPPAAAAGFFIRWAEQRGSDLGGLRGSLGMDPLTRLVRGGRLAEGLADAWALAMDLTRWCEQEAPGLRTLRIDATPYHAAGASPAQELAVALSLGVDLLRRGEAENLEPERVARRVDTVFSVGRRLFVEVAKLRAWRRLWSRVLTASDAAAAVPEQTLHLMPSEPWGTRVDPWVNMLRSTTQVFIGALSGADSVVAETFDRHFGAPVDQSRRVAINIHHVLAEESFLAQVADPAGGSWALEALTEQLAQEAWTMFQDLDRHDGLEAALISGTLQARIAETAVEKRRNLARRKDVVVGVSMFPQLDERRPDEGVAAPVPEPKCSDSATRGPILSLADVRSALASGSSWSELQACPNAADTTCEPLPVFREAADFEALRLRVDRMAVKDSRPRMVRAHLGAAGDSRVRSQFAADFFAVAGFDTDHTWELGQDAGLFAKQTTDPPAEWVVLCSSDSMYADLAAPAAAALKSGGVKKVLLAGRAGEHEAAWRQAGVDDFIYLGCDVVAVLEALVDAVVPEEGSRPREDQAPGEDN